MADDEVGVVMQHGVGDHVLVAGLAAAIGRHYGVRVVLAGRSNMGFIADLYPSVVRYVELPTLCVGHEVGGSVIARGTWAYGHFRGMELAKMVGYADMGLLDAYRCLFGLKADEFLERPKLPDEIQRQQARAFLSERGHVPGRTIFLSASARSTPLPAGGTALFHELRNALESRGYTYLDNERSDSHGAQSGEIPLSLMRAVVVEAGGFVAVRNGLCDLLCDLPVQGVILYSSEHYQAGSLFQGTRVSAYGYTDHIHEIEMPAAGDARGMVSELMFKFHDNGTV